MLEPGQYTTRYQDLGTDVLVRRPGRDTQEAARGVAAHQLPGYGGELKGRVAFACQPMDAFCEEDEPIVGHAADACHCIDTRRTSRHLLVRSGGQVIAETIRPLALYESGFAPRWYVPRADTDETALTAAEGQTCCPYKGLASYYDIGAAPSGPALSGRLARGRRISGLISFEPDRAEVCLDCTPAAAGARP